MGWERDNFDPPRTGSVNRAGRRKFVPGSRMLHQAWGEFRCVSIRGGLECDILTVRIEIVGERWRAPHPTQGGISIRNLDDPRPILPQAGKAGSKTCSRRRKESHFSFRARACHKTILRVRGPSLWNARQRPGVHLSSGAFETPAVSTTSSEFRIHAAKSSARPLHCARRRSVKASAGFLIVSRSISPCVNPFSRNAGTRFVQTLWNGASPPE